MLFAKRNHSSEGQASEEIEALRKWRVGNKKKTVKRSILKKKKARRDKKRLWNAVSLISVESVKGESN